MDIRILQITTSDQLIHYKLQKEMKMQEQLCDDFQNRSTEPSLRQAIIRHPRNATKIIKCLFDVFSALGYTSSLRALQKQTNMMTQQQRTNTIKNHLQAFRYREACEHIHLLDIPSFLKKEIVNDLQELQLDYWIYNGEQSLVLNKMMTNKLSQARKIQICEMIALGTNDIEIKQIENRHRLIIQKCQQESLKPSNIKKMLHQFISSQFKQIKEKNVKPPKDIIAESQNFNRIFGKVNFIKFNQTSSKIGMLSESSKDYELSVWRINNKLVQRQAIRRSQSIGWISQLKWSHCQHSPQREVIGVCSYESIIIFSAKQLDVIYQINHKEHQVQKFLCLQWHPISQILYVGGIFSKIIGFDSAGDLITELNPFFKTRQIVFSAQGNLYAIGATSQGHLIKYCISQQKIQGKFASKSIFMDLKYHEGKLLAIDKDFAYVLDAQNLAIINKICSPNNQKLYRMEVFQCQSWIITFNVKLQGIQKLKNCIKQTLWDDCEAVDVKGNQLVTFKTSIRVWGVKEEQQPSEQHKRQLFDPEKINRQASSSSQSDSSSSSSVSSSPSFHEMNQIEQQISSEEGHEYQQMVQISYQDLRPRVL